MPAFAGMIGGAVGNEGYLDMSGKMIREDGLLSKKSRKCFSDSIGKAFLEVSAGSRD